MQAEMEMEMQKLLTDYLKTKFEPQTMTIDWIRFLKSELTKFARKYHRPLEKIFALKDRVLDRMVAPLDKNWQKLLEEMVLKFYGLSTMEPDDYTIILWILNKSKAFDQFVMGSD